MPASSATNGTVLIRRRFAQKLQHALITLFKNGPPGFGSRRGPPFAKGVHDVWLSLAPRLGADTVSWRSRLNRPLLILCILVGVLGGVGAHTFHFADGLAYAGNDPKACVNCHIMRDQYNGWQISSHHNHATCNDCHVCIRCHQQLVSAMHGPPDEKGCYPLGSVNCVRCHQEVGHGPTH
jgi:hypothetical protein